MAPAIAISDVFCAHAPKGLGAKHASKPELKSLSPISFMIDFSGHSWAEASCKKEGCVKHPDKDDLNLIFNKGRFVDLQIFWRKNVSASVMRYCDSDPCNQARAVTTKTSIDGINWSEDSAAGPILPDEQDPEDLQFYRSRPFYVGNTSRVAAHTLLYAPGPPLSLVGPKWGRQPLKCKVGPTVGEICHGPHMYEQWWVGPVSGDAAETTGWRRPVSIRATHAAPHDAFLMAPPVTFEGKHVWVGSTGTVYSLPLYRITGLYSASNAEAATHALTVPTHPLAINADARWYGSTVTGGCDEGCSAYIFVEVVGATSGQVVPGYSRYNFTTLMNVSGGELPLLWGGNLSTVPLAGKEVQLRIAWRDATLYALTTSQH